MDVTLTVLQFNSSMARIPGRFITGRFIAGSF